MKRESDERFGSSILGKADPWNTSAPSGGIGSLNTDGGVPPDYSVEEGSGTALSSRSSYMCRKCKAHGRTIPVKRHKRSCPYLGCTCIRCLLVDQGRKVVARQIALYRDQKGSSTEPTGGSGVRHGGRSSGCSRRNNHPSGGYNSSSGGVPGGLEDGRSSMPSLSSAEVDGINGPHCRRCRNHNITVTWKGHKKTCPHRTCPCSPCNLINVRKDTEKTLRDMTTHKEEGFLNTKPDLYPYSSGSSFVPSFHPTGCPPLHPAHPSAISAVQSQGLGGTGTGGLGEPGSLHSHLLGPVSVPYCPSVSSTESPLSRMTSSASGMPSPAMFAASHHAGLASNSSSLTTLTSAAAAAAGGNPYEITPGDFKPPPFSFSHPSQSAGVYSRYQSAVWNGIYSQQNVIDNRAAYPNCQSYNPYFTSLHVNPPVPTNGDPANVAYRSLTNYCY